MDWKLSLLTAYNHVERNSSLTPHPPYVVNLAIFADFSDIFLYQDENSTLFPMTSFRAFEKDIEVNGATILSIVRGFEGFRALADKALKDVGLDNVQDDITSWYSQQAWLDSFRIIAERVGVATLLLVGQKIPDSAQFPPDIENIEQALRSIDIAYHMNHRNAKGQVLYDPSSMGNKMLEGIGHYTLKSIDHENKVAIMVCENPYPSDFDRGIIAAMAQRFEPDATVTLDKTKSSRKTGGDSCTFIIKW